MAKPKQVLSPQEKQKRAGERQLKKAANFKKLAGKRVARALHAIKQVERLANRNSYAYSTAQVSRILEALQAAGRATQQAFARSPETPKVVDTFDVGE